MHGLQFTVFGLFYLTISCHAMHLPPAHHRHDDTYIARKVPVPKYNRNLKIGCRTCAVCISIFSFFLYLCIWPFQTCFWKIFFSSSSPTIVKKLWWIKITWISPLLPIILTHRSSIVEIVPSFVQQNFINVKVSVVIKGIIHLEEPWYPCPIDHIVVSGGIISSIKCWKFSKAMK